MTNKQAEVTRRAVLKAGAATSLLATMPASLAAQTLTNTTGDVIMSFIESFDVNIF